MRAQMQQRAFLAAPGASAPTQAAAPTPHSRKIFHSTCAVAGASTIRPAEHVEGLFLVGCNLRNRGRAGGREDGRRTGPQTINLDACSCLSCARHNHTHVNAATRMDAATRMNTATCSHAGLISWEPYLHVWVLEGS